MFGGRGPRWGGAGGEGEGEGEGRVQLVGGWIEKKVRDKVEGPKGA